MVHSLVTTEEAITAFIRKKKVNGYEYAQLVESYREGGKVRQRVLLHLGTYSPAEALIYWTAFGENHANHNWQKWAAKARLLRELIAQGKISITDDDRQQVEAKRAEALKRLEELERRFMRG